MEKIKMTIIVDMEEWPIDRWSEDPYTEMSLKDDKELTLYSSWFGNTIGKVISVENIEILK